MEGRLAEMPTAGSVARDDGPTASLEEPLGDVRERVQRSDFDTAVVVNAEGIVLGILRPKHLDGPDKLRVEEVMSAGPSTFRPHVLIHEITHYMHEHEVDSVPVTTGDGRLVGLLLREDAARVTEELQRRLGAHELHELESSDE
jgi:CBS domain-containing protein